MPPIKRLPLARWRDATGAIAGRYFITSSRQAGLAIAPPATSGDDWACLISMKIRRPFTIYTGRHARSRDIPLRFTSIRRFLRLLRRGCQLADACVSVTTLKARRRRCRLIGSRRAAVFTSARPATKYVLLSRAVISWRRCAEKLPGAQWASAMAHAVRPAKHSRRTFKMC